MFFLKKLSLELTEGVHHVGCDLFLGKAVFGLGRNVLGARGSWSRIYCVTVENSEGSI